MLLLGVVAWNTIPSGEIKPGPPVVQLGLPRMDNVSIEVVDKGDSVKLILGANKMSQEQLQALQQLLPKK